jgi:hypothetical protein
MSKYLKTREGSLEDLAKQMQNKVLESDYQDKFKKELDKAGRPIGQMTGAEKKAFFNKLDKMHTAKDEQVIKEKKNYKNNTNFFVNDKTDTLKKMTGRRDYSKRDLLDYLAQKTDKKEDDVYFDDTDLVYIDKTVLKDAETKTVDQMLKALQKEAVDNPYAVGMAQAMKAKDDQPPLKKSTITKAHDIAKSIEKDQKEEVEVKETHSFVTNKQNQKQKEVGGEKEPIKTTKNEWKTFAMMAAELREKKEQKKEDKKEMQAGDDTRDKKQKTMTGEIATSPEMNPKVDYKY